MQDCGGRASHSTLAVTVVISFAVTATETGLSPVTEQLVGSSDSSTSCVPTARPVNVTLPFASTGWLSIPLSITTRYEAGISSPALATVTSMDPTSSLHVRFIATGVDPPAFTVTDAGLAVVTVQLAGTSVSSTP